MWCWSIGTTTCSSSRCCTRSPARSCRPRTSRGRCSAVFADHPSVTVAQADVTAIDFATRTVTTADGDLGAADYLVLAAGAQPNFFGVTGASEHSFPLYSVTDAERLRLHLHGLLRVHCDPTRPHATANR